jgi:hypothetical protein
MFDRNKIALLATVAVVSVPLVAVGLRPGYLVAISIQPRSEEQLRVLCKESLTPIDGSGVAFFDFRASTNLPTGGKLQLQIRPDADPTFHQQRYSYSIDNGMVAGVAELGSVDWPLLQDEGYTFRVIDANGSSVLDGRIVARAHPLLNANQWLIIAVGVLASVIQIVVTFWPKT